MDRLLKLRWTFVSALRNPKNSGRLTHVTPGAIRVVPRRPAVDQQAIAAAVRLAGTPLGIRPVDRHLRALRPKWRLVRVRPAPFAFNREVVAAGEISAE